MTTILLLLPAVTALSPFATPKAWDAVSLGGPVVIKTGDTHTLFYHYRSVDDKDNEELPPLSTGRVGRAVSADGGLTFERQFDGLGAGGAVLSANVDDWYWFDSGHVGLGDVLYGGDATFLYTFGGSNSPMALRDVGIDKDGECYGMDLKMGVCVSQDGVKFGRIEGDEADGSILSPDPSSWERPGAPVGWPCVTRSPTNAETGELYLYYGATADSDGKAAVGVAKSKNGVLWTRCATAAPCLAPGAPGAWDAGAILRRSVIEAAGGYVMFYEARDEENAHRVGRATSTDGLTWEKDGANPVFAPSDDGWDSGAVSSPCVVEADGGLRMYYAANARGAAPMSLGVASSADGGLSWERLN